MLGWHFQQWILRKLTSATNGRWINDNNMVVYIEKEVFVTIDNEAIQQKNLNSECEVISFLVAYIILPASTLTTILVWVCIDKCFMLFFKMCIQIVVVLIKTYTTVLLYIGNNCYVDDFFYTFCTQCSYQWVLGPFVIQS